MPATLDDGEVARLESYLECVERLYELKVVREGVPCSFELKVSDGQVASIKSEIPPPDEIATLLHRLRPLILMQEPTSFLNISSLLGKRFDYAYLREVLREQRRQFEGRYYQELGRVTSNGTTVNSDEVLFAWLNGYEYHRDPDKREWIESLHHLIPLEHSMAFFVGLLSEKIDAIIELAKLVAVILGKQQEVQIVRRRAKSDVTGKVSPAANVHPS